MRLWAGNSSAVCENSLIWSCRSPVVATRIPGCSLISRLTASRESGKFDLRILWLNRAAHMQLRLTTGMAVSALVILPNLYPTQQIAGTLRLRSLDMQESCCTRRLTNSKDIEVI
eukprot:TRINITY_DN111766_c0_g1_i1.p2 TRINITY_DN111766_c0_g1~~TRINITY_DN111766_c0_g1_i1.p2  ORF type:complete len:115 (+),score=12.95 TRINITY_DN111766_c0_g1_i1:202-546(+)